MESRTNAPQNEENSFDVAQMIALCGLIPIAWLLIAMCVH